MLSPDSVRLAALSGLVPSRIRLGDSAPTYGVLGSATTYTLRTEETYRLLHTDGDQAYYEKERR